MLGQMGGFFNDQLMSLVKSTELHDPDLMRLHVGPAA